MIRWAGRATAAWTKPRADLIVENLCLRQQLIVLQRRAPRPGSVTATAGSSEAACQEESSLVISRPLSRPRL
jgi:hypothetical protein